MRFHVIHNQLSITFNDGAARGDFDPRVVSSFAESHSMEKPSLARPTIAGCDKADASTAPL